ncbi:hypothetical protein TL16_g09634 [Triparma laevis f. inornata]|uniref:Uncharacterized protein n=2 Tax=Triparma laevis TaxID=1534972 RepID=A0A9W7AHZ0_9STRA|nr:hypothetical protein TrLO_g13704 [Triparma laevis f. longispina]GMH83553.1 hypothetical protein TL16_g09634 [Triparma laevis f. inornata]
MPPRPLSGLQTDVLALYRNLLRHSLKKSPQTYENTVSQFRREAGNVKRMDFKRIEYGLRRGWKFVKILEMEGTKGMK